MLFLAHTNHEQARQFFSRHVEDLERVVFSSEDFQRESIEELLNGTDLFASRRSIFWRDLVSDGVITKELLEQWAPQMEESEYVWCVFERDAKQITKEVTRYAKAAQTAPIVGTKKSNEFNVFHVSDALLARDRKRFWILYQRALQAGITPDEIVPLFWWQIKILAQVLENPTNNPGLKPFVYQKALRAQNTYQLSEVIMLAKDIIQVLGEGREQQTTPERFEQLILAV